MIVKHLKDLVAHFSRCETTLRKWKDAGCPGFKVGEYDVELIETWYAIDGPGRPKEASTAANASSPGLERYRAAKADLAERELSERQSQLIRRVDLIAAADLWRGVLQRLAVRLAADHGPAAGQIVSDALAECDEVIRREFAITQPDAAAGRTDCVPVAADAGTHSPPKAPRGTQKAPPAPTRHNHRPAARPH